MKPVVYFDLETRRSAEEVGGWDRIHDMGLSVGVTYDAGEDRYRIYSEGRVAELIRELRGAALVVGFNIRRFDFAVLQGYDPFFDPEQIPTLDLLLDLQKILNHRLSLDAVASATLGAEKTADGLQALRWFREGRLLEIAEYCCYDVKITRLVHEFGRAHRQVFYASRNGQRLSVPVQW